MKWCANIRARPLAVAITWWRKQGDEFRAATQERNRPKVGRMARLKGQVEPLAVDRVALVNAEVAEKLEKMRAEERAKPAAAAREKLTAGD